MLCPKWGRKVNKFLAPLPTALTPEGFFDKWKQFAANETLTNFTAKTPSAAMAAALTSFKLPPVLAVDPNAANFVRQLRHCFGPFGR